MSVLLPARGLQPQERDQLGFLWEGCRRGSHPRGERPSGSGQRPNSLIAWSLRPALPGEACSAARVCGKACAAAGSGLQWLLRVCHSRALSPARLAGQRQDTAGGGGAPRRLLGVSPPSSVCCSAPPWFRKPLTHLSAQVTKAFCSSQWLVLVVFTEYLLCVRWSDSGVE